MLPKQLTAKESLALDLSESDCEVSGPMALVLRVSRVVGAAPLRVGRVNGKTVIAPSPALAVLHRLLITACNLVSLGGLAWDFTLEPGQRIRVGANDMKSLAWTLDLFFVMLTASIAVYTGPSRVINLIQVLKQMQQINSDLRMQPPLAKSNMVKNVAVVVVLVWTVGTQLVDIYDLTFTAITENKTWPVMCMYCAFYYGTILNVLLVLQWFCLVRAAGAAAAALNRQLEQLLNPESISERQQVQQLQPVNSLMNGGVAHGNNPEVPWHPSQAQATLRRLAVAYGRVSEVMLWLNAGNGFFLLVMITSLFLRLVVAPYFMLLGLVEGEDVGVSVVALQLNWCVFHVASLLAIVEPCHQTHLEREHTGHLLSQLTVSLAPESERLSWELDQFAKQVSLDNASFTPLGAFTLSRPLVATILSGVISYLIMVIEFQKISNLFETDEHPRTGAN